LYYTEMEGSRISFGHGYANCITNIRIKSNILLRLKKLYQIDICNMYEKVCHDSTISRLIHTSSSYVPHGCFGYVGKKMYLYLTTYETMRYCIWIYPTGTSVEIYSSFSRFPNNLYNDTLFIGDLVNDVYIFEKCLLHRSKYVYNLHILKNVDIMNSCIVDYVKNVKYCKLEPVFYETRPFYPIHLLLSTVNYQRYPIQSVRIYNNSYPIVYYHSPSSNRIHNSTPTPLYLVDVDIVSKMKIIENEKQTLNQEYSNKQPDNSMKQDSCNAINITEKRKVIIKKSDPYTYGIFMIYLTDNHQHSKLDLDKKSNTLGVLRIPKFEDLHYISKIVREKHQMYAYVAYNPYFKKYEYVHH